MLGPRGDLLTDVAAFGEGDTVQLVEAVFEQQRFLDHHVPATIRNAQRDPLLVPLREVALNKALSFEQSRSDAAGQGGPDSEIGLARVDEHRTAADINGTACSAEADRRRAVV